MLLENSPDGFDAKGGVQAGSLCTAVMQHRAEKGPELLEDGPKRVDAWQYRGCARDNTYAEDNTAEGQDQCFSRIVLTVLMRRGACKRDHFAQQ